MSAGTRSPHGEETARWLTIGSGWQWPALFVVVFVGLFYVPAHRSPRGSTDDLVAPIAATIASLYLILLSVAGARLVRGIILRAGGSRDPIALVGRGRDPLTSDVLRPRWRLTAIAAGTLVPLAVAGAAAQLAAGVDPASYAHALANLALGVNAALAAGVLVPAPGFTGWALLLGLLDVFGARPDRRVWRAARITQAFGVPMLLVGGTTAALGGDPRLMFLGFLLAFHAWNQSQLTAGEDATVRFLAAHVAGDVARPATSRAEPDETVVELLGRLGTSNAVSLVGFNGVVIGAIGPRQLGPRGVAKRDGRCADHMVPLGSLRMLGPSSAAVELLPEIARHGFALVTGVDGVSYVETADLGHQIRIWVALGQRRVRERPSRPSKGV